MPRVLIIDDDDSLRGMLRVALEGDGHQVAEAAGGAEGLRLLRERGADLVLCDVFMPGTDGLETLGALKDEFPGLPVVSMSGGGFGGQVDMLGVARALGARAVLYKPFKLQAVRDVLRQTLGAPAGAQATTSPSLNFGVE
jgi:DNA-binding NtrC family response regulator